MIDCNIKDKKYNSSPIRLIYPILHESSSTVKTNETVRMTISLKNKLNHGLPMTMAVVDILAGLSAQPWQLKELQEKEIFDFYEIRNEKLSIYYRQLSPNDNKKIELDLKAELQGTFTGAASSTYLYYTDEFKHWVIGNTITIL